MKNISKKDFEKMEVLAREAMEKLNNGENLNDILAGIYVENLEGKSFHQGLVMAEAAISHIEEFDADYAAAKENMGAYLDEKMALLEGEKTLAEKCNFWKNFIAALAAANMESEDPTAETQAEKIAEASISEEEATPEMLDELREKAKEAMMNNGIMVRYLLAHGEELETMADGDEAARVILRIGQDDTAYRAIITMIAYTQAKNGGLKNIPADWTIDQIATVVCTHHETTKIAAEVASGNLAVEIAEVLLVVLGTVAIISLFTCTSTVAFLVMFIATMVGEAFILPAVLVSVGICVWAMIKGVNAWVDACPAIAKASVKLVTTTVKAVVTGVKMLYAFITETVLPGIVSVGKSLMGFVKKLVFGKKNDETVIEGELIEEV